MPPPRRRRFVPLAAALLLAACGSSLPAPSYWSEEPPGSRNWTEIPALPAWVEGPPRTEGMVRFVFDGRSNARSVAAHPGKPERQLRRRIDAALAGVVNAEDAALVADATLASIVLVHRVSKDEVLTRRLVAGNTLSTVWSLWEAPLDAVLAPLPAASRDAARAALGR